MDSRFFSSRMDVFIRVFLRSKSQIVPEEADQSPNHRDVAQPLQRPLPQFDRPWNARIFRQAAVDFRLRGVMQNVNHSGTANTGWVVHPRIREIRMIAKLLRSSLRKELHIVLAAEVQAPRGSRLDARRFQPFAYAIRAQRALEHAIGLRVHLWNIERTARDAVAAPAPLAFLKTHTPIRIPHHYPVPAPSPHP